jgi:hypothetical protein
MSVPFGSMGHDGPFAGFDERDAWRVAKGSGQKKTPLAAGSLVACLLVEEFFPLFLFLSDAVFAVPLAQEGASAVPVDSYVAFPRESPQRGLRRSKVAVWAICHVVVKAPAVKIFDAWAVPRHDITRTPAAEKFVGSIT